MNRIKKFYRDHESEILTAVVTTVVTATIVSLRTAEACSVDRVKASRTTDGEVHIFVFQKNGIMSKFDGPPRELK